MRYSIIYADPPWRFGSRGARSGQFGELDYRDMGLKELCALEGQVKEITADNAALFLWVTSAHLISHAPSVITAWGFKYVRVDSVWKKVYPSGAPKAVCGPWGMSDAEFLLMAVKGTMCSAQEGKRNLNTIVEAEHPGKHSQKPEIFRQRIEQRFGAQKRLEMFARENVPGWDCIGDDLDGLDIKESLSVSHHLRSTQVSTGLF